MTRRRVTAVAAAVVAIGAGTVAAVPADAEIEARLTGRFAVAEVVIEHASTPASEGVRTVRNWRFTPRCARGGCATDVRFTTRDGAVVHTLRRLSNARYRGTTKYLGNCYSKRTGNVVARKAYRVTSTLQVVIEELAPNGHVIAFRTDRRLRHERRPGAPRRCDARDFVHLTGAWVD